MSDGPEPWEDCPPDVPTDSPGAIVKHLPIIEEVPQSKFEQFSEVA